MAVVKASVNLQSILEETGKVLTTSKRVERLVFSEAHALFRVKKQRLLSKFYNHPVTQELQAGPEAGSSFLPYGNLFSFIGFYSGDDPTQEIASIFEEFIRVSNFPVFKKRGRDGVEMGFTIFYPLLEEIWNATPYPDGWKDGSWANDLEKRGISWFQFYVFSLTKFQGIPNSRSGTALQNRRKQRGTTFNKPIPYIKALLMEFKESFSR